MASAETVAWLRAQADMYRSRLEKRTSRWRRVLAWFGYGRADLDRWVHAALLVVRAESELEAQRERPATLRLVQGGRR